MSNLKDLIAKSKQPQTQPEPQPEDKPKFKFNLKPSNGSDDTKQNSPLANSSGSVPSAPEKSISSGVKFNFSGQSTSPSRAEVKQTLEDGAGNSSSPSNPPNAVSPPSELVDGTSMDEIGDIDISDFVFDEQPDNFSPEAIDKMNSAMDILKNSMDNKEMVGQAITIIMKTMQEHEFLKDIMREHPHHLGLMVQGLRESYGSVIAKKSATKTKRRESAEKVEKTLDMLQDIGFSMDDA